MQQKVSVVTSCYNKEKYVSSMLESVCNQTWDNIEVVVVNDGSTDGSLKVIEQCIPKLRQRGFDVILIDQENTGVARALHNGLIKITGEYFCLPDADDLLKPEYVSALVGVFENHPDCDVALCRYYGGISSWDPENDVGMKYKVTNPVDNSCSLSLITFLLGRSILSVCNCLFKSDLLNVCDCLMFLREGARVSQEPPIWLPLLDMNAKAYYCNETLYLYRTEANSHGINGRKCYEDKMNMLEQGKLLRDNIINRLRPHDAKYYLNINHIRYLFGYYEKALNFNMTKDADNYKSQLIEKIRADFFDCGKCDNAYAIFRTFVNHIMPIRNDYISRLSPIPPKFKRVIGYGAMGITGKKLLPLMLETPLMPNVLWDAAAKADRSLYDIPLALPELDGLSSGDAVLVLIRDIKLAEPLYERLRDTGATVLYYYDILDYMAKYYFPDL